MGLLEYSRTVSRKSKLVGAIFLIIIASMLIIDTFSIEINGLSGFAVFDKNLVNDNNSETIVYNINNDYYSYSETSLDLSNLTNTLLEQNRSIKKITSIKINGIINGTASIYIADDKKTYLIAKSAKEKSISSITGLIIDLENANTELAESNTTPEAVQDDITIQTQIITENNEDVSGDNIDDILFEELTEENSTSEIISDINSTNSSSTEEYILNSLINDTDNTNDTIDSNATIMNLSINLSDILVNENIIDENISNLDNPNNTNINSTSNSLLNNKITILNSECENSCKTNLNNNLSLIVDIVEGFVHIDSIIITYNYERFSSNESIEVMRNNTINSTNSTFKIYLREFDNNLSKKNLSDRLKKLNVKQLIEKQTEHTSYFDIDIEDKVRPENKIKFRELSNLDELQSVEFIDKKKHNNDLIVSDIIYVNSINMTNATISLKSDTSIDAIAVCQDYDSLTNNCPLWENSDIPFTYDEGIITFTVEHFTGYGGIIQSNLTYLTSTTNFTNAVALISLAYSRDTRQNYINRTSTTITGTSILLPMLNASINNLSGRIIRTTDTINFSIFWQLGSNAAGNATYKLFKNSSGTLTSICQVGNDGLTGVRIAASANTIRTGQCSPSSNITLNTGDGLVLSVNFWVTTAGAAANRWARIWWDNTTANSFVNYTYIVTTDINVSVNQSIFTTNSSANITGYFYWINGSFPSPGNVTIRIYNTSSTLKYITNVTSGINGFYTTNYTISTDSDSGIWSVNITGIYNSTINATNQTTFSVYDPVLSICKAINVSGIYTFNQTMIPSSGVCINISAPNVTINCNQNSLSNTSFTGTAIESRGFNTTIKNCFINISTVSGVGIVLLNSNYSTILNNNFSVYTAIGASNSSFSNVSLNNASVTGYFTNSFDGDNNSLSNNLIYGTSGSYGIAITGNNSFIINNTIAISNGGIVLREGSKNNIVRNNNISKSGISFYILSGASTTTNNTIVNNSVINAARFVYSPGASSCNNNFTLNHVGDGISVIEYYNYSVSIINSLKSGLILCGASYSNITNLTLIAPAGYNSSGIEIYGAAYLNATNINASVSNNILNFNPTYSTVKNLVGPILTLTGNTNNFDNITLANSFFPCFDIYYSDNCNFSNMVLSNCTQGIRSYDSDNATFNNISSNNNLYQGILLQQNQRYNIFNNISLANNGISGIYFYDSPNNSINVIYSSNNTINGILLVNSSNTFITNLTSINNSNRTSLRSDIFVNNSNDVSFIRGFISSNNYAAILLNSSANVSISEFNISGNSTADVVMLLNSNLTVINVTYTTENVSLNNNSLYRKWKYLAYTNYSDGTPISSISILVNDYASNIINLTTNTTGYAFNNFTEYFNNGSLIIYYNNYTFNVTEGFTTISLKHNLTTDKNIFDVFTFNFNNCRNISISGTSLTLTQDIQINNSNCINVLANNVIIDCAGYNLIGNNATNAVAVYSNSTNATVQNCTISNFIYGILLNKSSNSTIRNNNISLTNSSSYAIYSVSGSNNTLVYRNILSVNASDSYDFYSVSTATFSNITENTILAVGSNSAGILFDDLSNSIVYYNNISNIGSSTYGIHLFTSANNNTVRFNNISANGSSGAVGLRIAFSSSSNLINSNIISTYGNSVGYGITVANSPVNNIISYNNISTTGSSSAVLRFTSSSNNNTIFNNILSSQGFTAHTIEFFANSHNNTFYNNTLNASSFTATHILTGTSSLSNNFYYNNFTGSGYWVNNSNLSNNFNTSVAGVPQGNYYAGISNYAVYDSNGDGWGDSGNQYPFNSTTILNKWFANSSDFGPYTTRQLTTVSSRITPINSTPNETIIGYCNGTESEGVNVSYIYTWYLNDVLNYTNITSSNWTSGLEVNTANLSSALLSANQNWTLGCRVATLGANATEINSSRTTIAQPLASSPIISDIISLSAVDPIELSDKLLQFNFTIIDLDGNSTINISSARTVINISDYTKSSSECSGFAINSTAVNVSCNISMSYYYSAGVWSVNVSINDTSNLYVENISTTFIYNQLTAISINSNSFDFGSISSGQENITTTPIIFRNTGNANFSFVRIKGYDLINSTGIIGTGNFSINFSNVSTGNILLNNSFVNITNSSLAVSNDTYNSTVTVYIYADIPIGLPALNYLSILDWVANLV